MSSEPVVAYKHKARVVRGKNGQGQLVPYDYKMAQSDVNTLMGREVFFVLYDSEEVHSPGQMAYYRGVMLKQAVTTEEYSGRTPEELHKDLLAHFQVETLSGMKWNDMHQWIENCKDFFMEEAGLEFPEDNKYMQIK
tara:strand:- start:1710 stop:2120 length:411 start_codon:yes stop_codon:yes gene_type:complete